MNSKELQQQWDDVCSHIKSLDDVDTAQINAFFSQLHPQAMSPGFLMLTTDNDFIKTWVERHYLEIIKTALQTLFGVPFSVLIEIEKEEEAEDAPAAQASTAGQVKSKTTVPTYIEERKEESDAAVQPGGCGCGWLCRTGQGEAAGEEQADDADPALDLADEPEESTTQMASYTFENFVIGDSNRMAYSTAVAVAETPGKSHLNPLFIYGKSGLGKTHLMCAIKHYINENMPHLKCVYVDSHDFLNEYTDSVIQHDKEKTSYKNFKKKYINADVLLIDDVQFFQGKTQTLDIVFQIFNQLTNQGKQIVLSADRAPKNINIDERYKSRFNQGGTFDIQPPEVETKLGIVKGFLKEYKEEVPNAAFDISPEIQLYIAENSSSNIRELKAAITKVIFQMTSFGKTDISIDEVKTLLENHYSSGPTKRLSIEDIQKEVESYYKVSHSDLVGKKRTRDIIYARQVALYLCREMLDLPFKTIGNKFNKDHSTVIYSVTNVEEKMKESREMREEIENIKNLIRNA